MSNTTQNKEQQNLPPADNLMEHFKAIELPTSQPIAFPKTEYPQQYLEYSDEPDLEEDNKYRSAGVLMRRLAESIIAWRKELPESVEPAVIAILNGGVRIEVSALAQESFHGIRIEGLVNGVPCIMLAHQATVQLLCYVQPVMLPSAPRRKIGFIIDGKKSEA